MNEPNKASTSGGTALGILILVWFLGSIFSLVYFAGQEKTEYIAIVFGQLFFVFGMIFLISQLKSAKLNKEKEKNFLYPTTTFSLISFPMLFVLIGLVAICVGVILINPDIIPFEINWNNVAIVGMLLLFFMVGAGMVWSYFKARIRYNDRRLVSTQATVVELDFVYRDGIKLCAPIFKYTFNNKEYFYASNTYTNTDVFNIGDNIEVKINSMNPEELYFKSNANILILIIGISSLFVPTIAFIAYIKTLLGI